MNTHAPRSARVARSVAAAVLATSLGAGHAVAAPAEAVAQSSVQDSVSSLQQHFDQQLQQAREALGSSFRATGPGNSDPLDPSTWSPELLTAGIGLGVIAALLLVSSSSSAEGSDAGDGSADGSTAEGSSGSSNGSSSPELVGSAVGSADAIGSSDLSIPESEMEIHPSYPMDTDESIDVLEFTDGPRPDPRDADAAAFGVERWWVNSPAMKREVELQVRPAPNQSEPSPVLILLDGVNAWAQNGWVASGVQELMEDENVTLVMPTEARASFYLDWEDYDPALGHLKWETFITEELPELLEMPEAGLNNNGKIGIGGLSMGATGAIMLANANPELFDAAFGISGCYSTTTPTGYQTLRITIESRGGDVDNLLGQPGSDTERRYDVVEDPTGLRDIPVYVSAGGGQVPEDYYSGSSSGVLGTTLEQGSYVCTEDLDEAMRDHGMNHQEVDLMPEGIHDWDYFIRQLEPAWDHIKPALY